MRGRSFLVPLLFLGASWISAAPLSLIFQQGSLAPVLEKVFPATVHIVVKKQMPAEDVRFIFDAFFAPRAQPKPSVATAGAGVIIDAKEGHVVTNYHVIEGATPDGIVVQLQEGEECPATVVGFDEASDVALLKILPPHALTELPLADSDQVKVGDFVIAVGSPLGLRQTATYGIVSGLDRVISSGEGCTNFIQTDARLNPGNSGGPLLNLSGALIGINTQGDRHGIGFAVPSKVVMYVVQQLLKYGIVKPSVLGLQSADLTPELAKNLNLKVKKGVFVKSVDPGSPAQKGGLEAGDVITKFLGKSITSVLSLKSRLAQVPPNSKVVLEIVRQDRVLQLTLRTCEESACLEISGGRVHAMFSGAQLQEGKQGLEVLEVASGSAAEQIGLRVHDQIIGINGADVMTLAGLRSVLQKQEVSTFAIKILRGNTAYFLFATP